ncbi:MULTISPECIES: cytochrome c oxidase subunit II [unclassified Streptomyces]|uniref:cytochrome c oxidase subunit II n=1 Tax=unclassified Streptomyces TaxID=2593676 RepID=UPI00336A5EBC
MNRRHVFDQVFTLELALAAIVFVTVLGALLYSVVRRRAGSGVSPSRRAERPRMESYYVAVLAVVAVFLVVYTALANHHERHAPAHRPTVRVDVTAYQWCWQFAHPRARERAVSTTATCRDGRLPTLVVPTGRTVRIELTSRDVIHSLWVPALRYKMDAFPDHVNTFTLTFDREGRWIGRCAEFCGQRHHSMDFWLKAVSPRKYATWLHEHSQAGTGGASV